MKQSKYIKGYFMLGEPEILYQGLYDPEEKLWNGWMSPYFTKEVCKKILKSLSGTLYYNIQWFFKDDIFIYQDNEYLEEDSNNWVEHKPTVIDGIKYWQIGAWEWIWDLYQEIK
jgi:hypothetical protein